MVKAIPDDYPRLSPYLSVSDAAAAIAFYMDVLGAVERMRLPMADGRVGHAELEFGTSLLMLASEYPEFEMPAPKGGGVPVHMMLYVEDVDAVTAKAVAAGSRITEPLEDKFYGDRSATLVDPFGHMWTLASHVKDVTAEEMQQLLEQMEGGGTAA